MDYIEFGKEKKAFVIIPGMSIHSIMGSAEAIAEAYHSFTESYTVYVFDRAASFSDSYTCREMAEDTAQEMKRLGIEKADILGVSQGGMIAMYLAIDHPELVNKLILGSTLAKQNDTFLHILSQWETLSAEKNELGLLESFIDSVYSETTLKNYRDILLSSNKGITDEEYRRFLIMANACRSFDCYDELPHIHCPVLVLGSEGDRVVTAEGSKQIADALGCSLYLYDNSFGHGVYDEAPDYKKRCLDFLINANS